MTLHPLQNPQLKQEIQTFLDEVQKLEIKLDTVVLFGSFAKQTQHAESDIDLALFSDQFGQDEIQELMNLKKIAWRVSERLSPIPLNSAYLKQNLHPLIGEFKKYGQVIYGDMALNS